MLSEGFMKFLLPCSFTISRHYIYPTNIISSKIFSISLEIQLNISEPYNQIYAM